MEEEDIFSALEQLKAKTNGTAQEIREIVNELHAVCAALESADQLKVLLLTIFKRDSV